MKKALPVILSILLLLDTASRLLSPTKASAQSVSNGVVTILNAGAPANCAWPTGATVTSGLALCATTSGLYWAVNGGAFQAVAGAAGGVTSFNGRTGAVVSASGDYSFAQLSSPPTSVTAGTFSVTGATIK
jgi:hypothetical protein